MASKKQMAFLNATSPCGYYFALVLELLLAKLLVIPLKLLVLGISIQ